LTFFDRLDALQREVLMGMNVNLTPQLEELVRSKVSSGLYTSASEVVREALRLLEEQDRLRQLKVEELRREIRRGLDSGASQPWDAKALKKKARSRAPAKTTAA
jgi:antitoxin ParD1/3/4